MKAKKLLAILLPCLLLLIALIVLLVCFCGLRGIYVSVDDPNNAISFGVGEFERISGGNVLHGDYKTDGRVIEMTTYVPYDGSGSDDIGGVINSLLGNKDTEVKERVILDKLDGYNKISLNGVVYERVSLIKIQDNVSRVNVRFDMNGGDYTDFEWEGTESLPIGSYTVAPEFIPVEGEEFLGWFESPNGYYIGEEPVDAEVISRQWKDRTYYACWASQAEAETPGDDVTGGGGQEPLPGYEAASFESGAAAPLRNAAAREICSTDDRLVPSAAASAPAGRQNE